MGGWVGSDPLRVGTFRNQFREHSDIDPFLIPTVTGHRKTACKEEQNLI